MKDRHGLDPGSCQQIQPPFKIQERLDFFVVNVELEEVVGQLPVVERVPGVNPFPEQQESIFEPLFQDVSLDRRPLLEQVVLGVHPFGDEVAPALQNHLAVVRKVNADVGAVDLLLDDQRLVGDEPIGFVLTEVLVVIGALGAKQMGRSGVLDEIAM